MWGVDLDRFQFDGNLTWSAIMMNADGTIYGRYGSRAPDDHMEAISIEGLVAALHGALELHAKHPADAERLAAKVGAPQEWKSGELLPAHEGRFKKGDTSRLGCVHCHFVDEGIVKSNWLTGRPVTDPQLWSYPMPDVLGLHLDPKQRAAVTKVDAGSEAEAAGFRAGDRIASMEDQPLLSIADVQWVLHHAASPGSVRAQVERDGETEELTLALPDGWRRRADFTWRGSVWGLRPGIATKELPPEIRKAAKLPDDKLGLLITGLHQEWGVVRGRQFGARFSGLSRNDIIVALDGDDQPMTGSEFIAWWWQNTKPGQEVKVTVLRRGKPVDFKVQVP